MNSQSGNQGIMGSQTLESVLMGTTKPHHPQENKKSRPSDEQALKCPRCDSTNTKFCYYNNYSLSQPRYFCKSCRRYWTKGGTLRNVPVGGGCRKNRRPSSSSSNNGSSHNNKIIRSHEFILPGNNPISVGYNNISPLIPTSSYDRYGSSDDLSFAIAQLQSQTPLGLFEETAHPHFDMWATNPNFGMSRNHVDSSSSLGIFDRAFFLDHRGCNNYYGPVIEGEISEDRKGFVECDQLMKQRIEDNNGNNGGGGGNHVDDQTRVFWGFPRQQVEGDGNRNQPFVDSNGRSSLPAGNNGIMGLSYNNWQGLVNSPLV